MMYSSEPRMIFVALSNRVRGALEGRGIRFGLKEDGKEISFMISCEDNIGFEVRKSERGVNFDSVRFYLVQQDYQHQMNIRIHGQLFLKSALCRGSDFELYDIPGMLRMIDDLKRAPLAELNSCGIL